VRLKRLNITVTVPAEPAGLRELAEGQNHIHRACVDAERIYRLLVMEPCRGDHSLDERGACRNRDCLQLVPRGCDWPAMLASWRQEPYVELPRPVTYCLAGPGCPGDCGRIHVERKEG
jgi:hypothetical protein